MTNPPGKERLDCPGSPGAMTHMRAGVRSPLPCPADTAGAGHQLDNSRQSPLSQGHCLKKVQFSTGRHAAGPGGYFGENPPAPGHPAVSHWTCAGPIPSSSSRATEKNVTLELSPNGAWPEPGPPPSKGTFWGEKCAWVSMAHQAGGGRSPDPKAFPAARRAIEAVVSRRAWPFSGPCPLSCSMKH